MGFVMKKDMFDEIVKNKIKTVIIFIVFFVFIMLVGVALKYIFSYSGFGILFFAGLFAIVFAIVGYYSGDKLVLATSNAVLADEQKYMHLHNLVEGLSISAGIPKPKVYIIPDSAPNAFATGRSPKHSSVAVTEGLLKILNREELEAVIAHETSHIQNQDIKIMTLVTILFGLVAMASDIAIRSLFWGSISGSRNRNSGQNPILLIVALFFIIISPIIALLIQMMISRNREYLADSNGASLTRYPKGLANALRKISSVNQPVKNATKGTAHFYISNPLKSKSKTSIFSTHPPIEERIKRLEQM
jgi:heat shock protein HtpX